MNELHPIAEIGPRSFLIPRGGGKRRGPSGDCHLYHRSKVDHVRGVELTGDGDAAVVVDNDAVPQAHQLFAEFGGPISKLHAGTTDQDDSLPVGLAETLARCGDAMCFTDASRRPTTSSGTI